MEAKVQRVLIWSGPAMVVLWVGAFLLVAGFIPPPDPGKTAEQIVRIYDQRTGAIKIGMVVSMMGSALLAPWAIAISGQLRRIDGARALADVQMVSCALLSLEFIPPIGVWMAASFRFDAHSPEVTQALNDLGWILFRTVIWSLWVQLIAIGAAILIDRRDEPRHRTRPDPTPRPRPRNHPLTTSPALVGPEIERQTRGVSSRARNYSPRTIDDLPSQHQPPSTLAYRTRLIVTDSL